MKKVSLVFIAMTLALVFVPGVALAIEPGTNPFTRQLKGDVEQRLLERGAGAIIPGEQSGSQTYVNPAIFIIRWVRVLLSFLGIFTVAGIAYGGFLWMTAGGTSDQVDKAKKLLKNMIIGLVIILSGYSIAWFATYSIQRSTGSIGSGVEL